MHFDKKCLERISGNKAWILSIPVHLECFNDQISPLRYFMHIDAFWQKMSGKNFKKWGLNSKHRSLAWMFQW